MRFHSKVRCSCTCVGDPELPCAADVTERFSRCLLVYGAIGRREKYIALAQLADPLLRHMSRTCPPAAMGIDTGTFSHWLNKTRTETFGGVIVNIGAAFIPAGSHSSRSVRTLFECARYARHFISLLTLRVSFDAEYRHE